MINDKYDVISIPYKWQSYICRLSANTENYNGGGAYMVSKYNFGLRE